MGAKRQHAVEDFLTDKVILPTVRTTPMQGLASNETFARYARLVSLDQFFTAITSTVTYVTNGARKEAAPPKTFVERVERQQNDVNFSLSA
jgi:hypothetical protein